MTTNHDTADEQNTHTHTTMMNTAAKNTSTLGTSTWAHNTMYRMGLETKQRIASQARVRGAQTTSPPAQPEPECHAQGLPQHHTTAHNLSSLLARLFPDPSPSLLCFPIPFRPTTRSRNTRGCCHSTVLFTRVRFVARGSICQTAVPRMPKRSQPMVIVCFRHAEHGCCSNAPPTPHRL